jgi:hypothetical protein
MVDEFTYDGIMHSSVPFHEYTAANKLVTWVQQVRQLSYVQMPPPTIAQSFLISSGAIFFVSDR